MIGHSRLCWASVSGRSAGWVNDAALRQYPTRQEVPVDVRRRERERDIEQELVLAGGREVVEERPRLDRCTSPGTACGCPASSRGCRRRRGRRGRRPSGTRAADQECVGTVERRTSRWPLSRSACRLGNAPCSSRGSRMRQSAPSQAIRMLVTCVQEPLSQEVRASLPRGQPTAPPIIRVRVDRSAAHTLGDVPVCPACGEENPDRARFCMACAGPGTVSPAGSRKTVTIVFSDLVGSTALGEALDSEALREVLDRYFDEMSACVERHGEDRREVHRGRRDGGIRASTGARGRCHAGASSRSTERLDQS